MTGITSSKYILIVHANVTDGDTGDGECDKLMMWKIQDEVNHQAVADPWIMYIAK